MGAEAHTEQSTDAPTVALRLNGATATVPRRQDRRLLLIVLAVSAVLVPLAFVVLGAVASTPATSTVPGPAPAVAADDVLAQSERIDVTLAGLDSGLDLRRTWGTNLTGRAAASTCHACAALMYRSSLAAQSVFAKSCESTAVPQ